MIKISGEILCIYFLDLHMLIKISLLFLYIVALLHKGYQAIFETICLFFLLAITTLVGTYEEPVMAQITPSSNSANGVNDQDANDGLMSASDDAIESADPISPSGPPISNLNQSASSDHKYTVTPAEDVGPSAKEETLVEEIFNKVNEDLKASGIATWYP